MALKLNQTNYFNREIYELEYQVFQTLKWTFFFLNPLFLILKDALRFFIENFTNVFMSNHLTK